MKGVLLLACVLAGAPVRADADVATWPAADGTTVALVRDTRAPVVTIVLEFPTGSWSPWARREHARDAWEIQMHDAAGALRARADAIAARVSVGTEARACVLSVEVLKDDLDAAAALIHDVLRNREFDRRELATRRRSARISRAEQEREASFRLRLAAARTVFAEGDPRRLAWEREEPPSTDAAALATTRDAILRLPGRVAGFAGDLDRAEAERAYESLGLPPAGAAPDGLAPPFRPPVPRAARADTTVPLPKLTQVYFGLARESLAWTDDDSAAFLIADHVLGGHFYSRLYTALRHEGGETYGAGTTSLGDVVPNLYALSTFTRAENAARTEEKLRATLEAFHDAGITEAERADAAGYLLGRRAFSRQTPVQILERWLLERRLGVPEGFVRTRAERAAALPLETINAFIARWYDPAAFTMVRVAPAR